MTFPDPRGFQLDPEGNESRENNSYRSGLTVYSGEAVAFNRLVDNTFLVRTNNRVNTRDREEISDRLHRFTIVTHIDIDLSHRYESSFRLCSNRIESKRIILYIRDRDYL